MLGIRSLAADPADANDAGFLEPDRQRLTQLMLVMRCSWARVRRIVRAPVGPHALLFEPDRQQLIGLLLLIFGNLWDASTTFATDQADADDDAWDHIVGN